MGNKRREERSTEPRQKMNNSSHITNHKNMERNKNGKN